MAVAESSETLKKCTSTSIEGQVTIGTVSPRNQSYLMDKAQYGLLYPKLSFKRLKDGSESDAELKQLVMSGLIKVDEYLRDFFFEYKAEVSFDMRPPPPQAPIPYLSSSLVGGKKPDPDRRHTMTFFPSNSMGGFLRRPDVVIVKNAQIRWPGLECLDHDGAPHKNNVERVVEVKFPGDVLGRGQRVDYERIAGDLDRFAVLEVKDCRSKKEREADKKFNREHRPTQAYDPNKWTLPPIPERPPKEAPTPVPVYGPEPIPKPAQVERWTQKIDAAVDSLIEQGGRGLRDLSQDVEEHLAEAAAWISSQSEWLRLESQKAWEWVGEAGGEVMRWTDDQIREIWSEIQKYTDLTLEALREVDWVHWLVFVGSAVATAIVIIVVGEVVVALGIPASLIAGLMMIIKFAVRFWPELFKVLNQAITMPALRPAF
ncbi:VRR-NUC domain-containing protein [Pseudomonas sp. NPDC087598]|uniref:VRR-NUC domain-containing protein n=1 Tax=Pseudomonas sp. NPDC087598 TaxID=3364440 RepID=UPI003810F98D